jgi:hypothetical protein
MWMNLLVGLVGVVLGGIITLSVSWFFDKRQEQQSMKRSHKDEERSKNLEKEVRRLQSEAGFPRIHSARSALSELRRTLEQLVESDPKGGNRFQTAMQLVDRIQVFLDLVVGVANEHRPEDEPSKS